MIATFLEGPQNVCAWARSVLCTVNASLLICVIHKAHKLLCSFNSQIHPVISIW